MMRRLSDIVAEIAAARIKERQAKSMRASKESALLAFEILGERGFRQMLNLMESRIASRADSDPSALREFAHRLDRLADDLERRSVAGGDSPPAYPRRLRSIDGGQL